MTRPKGSKNQKTLEFEAHIEDFIAEKLLERKRMIRQRDRLQKEIEERKATLLKVRADLRRVDRELEALIARRDELNSERAELVRFREVEARVAKLIKNGLSADEILGLLEH